MEAENSLDEQLMALLKKEREEIYAVCITMLKQLPIWKDWEKSYPHLYTQTKCGLDAFLESLSCGTYVALESHLAGFKNVDFSMDVDIANSIDALFLFREATMSVLRRSIPCGSPVMIEACARLDAYLRHAVRVLARQHAAATNDRLSERLDRTAILLKIVEAAASTLDLNTILQRVGGAISVVLDVPRCTIGLVDEDRGRFVYQDVSMLETTDSPGTKATESPSRSLSEMGVLVEHILEKQEPFVCVDAQADPRISSEWVHRVRSVLGIPFIVKGRVVAMGFAYTLDERRDFEQEQIDLACGIANAVALSIENAWLHQQMKGMAILEERNRLAREMHGNLAQALGALQLKASQIAARLDSKKLGETHDRLGELEDMISAAHTDVRESIFNMRTVFSPGTDFLPALQEYLTAYRLRYGLDVQLEADDDLQLDWDGEVGLEVVRIIQEALTNVRKHAKTEQALLRIQKVDDLLKICMQDQGCGFNPLLVMSQGGHHVGLQSMRERAEKIGAQLKIKSQLGKGTALSLLLPLSMERGVF